MIDLYVLDDDGNPLRIDDVRVWATWFEGADRLRILAQDQRGAARVSTVFLGIDHAFSFGRHTRPVLWETMIFGGPHDGYCDRYTSRDDALIGHAAALALVEAPPLGTDA